MITRRSRTSETTAWHYAKGFILSQSSSPFSGAVWVRESIVQQVPGAAHILPDTEKETDNFTLGRPSIEFNGGRTDWAVLLGNVIVPISCFIPWLLCRLPPVD